MSRRPLLRARISTMRTQLAASAVIAPVLLKEVDIYQDKRYLTAAEEVGFTLAAGVDFQAADAGTRVACRPRGSGD